MDVLSGGAARWRERYDELATPRSPHLSAPDLESLAEAAFWLGRPRETIDAHQRAYALYCDSMDHDGAARVAWKLFHNHFELNETAVAGGWLSCSQRHVLAVPDSAERGYVAVAASMWARFSNKPDDAIMQATLAQELGEHSGDRDLAAWGLALRGGTLASGGDVSAGVTMLDEAMVEAVAGELSPLITGWIYCFLLKTCQALGDVQRAGDWTDSATRWCQQQGVDSWYPGLCRLHRCEVATMRGEWASAEEEAIRAAEELGPFGDYLIAEGHYLAGEIRRRRGEFASAEKAFRRAHELGHDAQPGLALLRLALHDADGAARQLRLALKSTSQTLINRARLLAADVMVELEQRDTQSATRSVNELAQLARSSDSRLIWALLATSHGSLLVAEDDVDRAIPLLREADSICHELGLPYESAQVRMILGKAARRAGDELTAKLQFEAAATTFDRLGARPDAKLAAAVASQTEGNLHGLSGRELDVLKLVARGMSNRDIAAELVLSEHTVRRHLSNIFRKIGVPSRAAATVYAFEHDLT